MHLRMQQIRLNQVCIGWQKARKSFEPGREADRSWQSACIFLENRERFYSLNGDKEFVPFLFKSGIHDQARTD